MTDVKLDDQSSASSTNDSIVRYGINDEPPLSEAIPLGIQHLLAMFLSTVALPLVIAGAIGLGQSETTFIVQMALLVAGVATIVQVYSVGPVGSRLPYRHGNERHLRHAPHRHRELVRDRRDLRRGHRRRPSRSSSATFYDDLRSLFPPLVTGVVVMLVGLTLVPTAIQYSAGGPGAETYGDLANLGVAGVVFLIAVLFNQYFDNFLSVASVLIAVVVGYLMAAPLGLLDLSGVADAGWVAVPMPLEFGVEFHPSAIVIAAFAYVVTSMETIGDVEGTTGTVSRRATSEEMGRPAGRRRDEHDRGRVQRLPEHVVLPERRPDQVHRRRE